MSVFEQKEFSDHQQVSFFKDPATGLKAIISIHSTKLGPAVGGVRFYPYENSEDALYDVLRLSKGMTYKCALAGLPLGGGKSVIIGDPKKDKTEELLEAFGKYLDDLGGRYIIGEDVGMKPEDLTVINRKSDHVIGLPGKSGDTAPLTAYGVYRAIQSAVDFKLNGKMSSVAILGFGNVGTRLADYLVKEGIKIYVADTNKGRLKAAVEEYGAELVGLDEIYKLDVDVFAPCALGGILNDTTIPQIRAKVVCGAANNQLEDLIRHGKMLADRGILYVPDYVANAGGVISGSAEIFDWTKEESTEMVKNIYDTCTNIYKIAEEKKCTPLEAAEKLAEEILNS